MSFTTEELEEIDELLEYNRDELGQKCSHILEIITSYSDYCSKEFLKAAENELRTELKHLREAKKEVDKEETEHCLSKTKSSIQELKSQLAGCSPKERSRILDEIALEIHKK